MPSPPPATPEAPAAVTLTAVNATQARVAWTRVPGGTAVDTFTAEAARLDPNTGALTTAFVTLATVAGSASSATIGGLSVATSYALRVRARAIGGSSSASLLVNFTTAASPNAAGSVTYPPVQVTDAAPLSAANATAIALEWTYAFSFPGGYVVGAFTVQAQFVHTVNGVGVDSAWSTVYVGAATTFVLELTDGAATAASIRIQATSSVGAVSPWLALPSITIAVPSVAPTAAPAGDACLNACSGASHGSCVNGMCRCAAAWLGVDCSIGDGRVQRLSSAEQFTMTTLIVDGGAGTGGAANGKAVIHFRMQATFDPAAPRWMSVCLKPLADGMKQGDCAVAALNGDGTAWELTDHFAPRVDSFTRLDAQQDLMNGSVWLEPSGLVVATWWRLLDTGDAVEDQVRICFVLCRVHGRQCRQ